MATFVFGAPPAVVRALAVGALTLVCGGFGGSAIAHAGWDSAEFDACTTRADTAWLEGDITSAEHIYFYELCCARTGGNWTPHGNQGLGVCGAQPIAAPSTPTAPPSQVANPDVPAGPPTSTPKPGPKTPAPKTSLTFTPIVPVG